MAGTYNPHITDGNKMFTDMIRQHSGDIFFAEYFYEKIEFMDAEGVKREQIVPRVVLDFKG